MGRADAGAHALVHNRFGEAAAYRYPGPHRICSCTTAAPRCRSLSTSALRRDASAVLTVAREVILAGADILAWINDPGARPPRGRATRARPDGTRQLDATAQHPMHRHLAGIRDCIAEPTSGMPAVPVAIANGPASTMGGLVADGADGRLAPRRLAVSRHADVRRRPCG